MNADDILDPLVRVAFTKKRDTDLLQQAAESTLKSIEAMQQEYEYQEAEAADSRAELKALMEAMSPEQHQELVLAELTFHQSTVLRARSKAANLVKVGSVVGAAMRSASFHADRDPLNLHKEGDLLNELQVVWRK